MVHEGYNLFACFGSSSAFFLCGKCSRRHLPVLFVLHFLIKEMWRDMWLLTKADKTHITIGSGRQEAICLSCLLCEIHVHWKTHWKCAWKEKVSQQIISKENNPLSDPYSQQYLSLHIQKWYNGLFSSAAYKHRLMSTATYKHRLISWRLISTGL